MCITATIIEEVSAMAAKVYDGTEPFVFISYAHKDAEIVSEILEGLVRVGTRIWYDEGLFSGADWAVKLEQRLIDCDRLLAFISGNFIESSNCRDEIGFALNEGKPVLLVRLDDTPYAHGLKLRLGRIHHTFFDGDVDALIEELMSGNELESCKSAVSTRYEFWRPSVSRFGSWLMQEERNAEDEMLYAEWGPERPLFHENEYPEAWALNSCVDHHELGDERYFASIRKKGTERWQRWITLEPNERYEVRLTYRVHGDPEKVRKGVALAQKIKASIHVPECVFPYHYGVIRGALHAIWPQPGPIAPEQEIWSSIKIYTRDSPLFLSFVPMTAKIHNGGKLDGTVLGTQLFNAGGVYLGVNNFSGVVPAGDKYMGSITFEFKTRAHQGDCTILRSVANKDGEFVTSMLEVKPGDMLTFKSTFENVTDVDLTNVTFRDVLGKGLELVPGTTNLKWFGGDQKLSDCIAANGINTGLYGPHVTGELTYQVQVPESELPCNYITTTNVSHDGGWRSSSLLIHVDGHMTDDARLVEDPEHDPRYAEWLESVPRGGGWGPEREMFTMKHPSRYAVFNSILDNNILGDERDFVRVMPYKTGKKYVNRLQVVPGYLYQAYVFYDNAASPSAGESGTARGVRLRMSFPTKLDAMSYGKVSATISASNTNPPAVWNGCILWAAEDVVMRYVPGSAKLYNGRHEGLPLDIDIFCGGVLLGADALDGVISCSDADAYGHVTVLLSCEEANA